MTDPEAPTPSPSDESDEPVVVYRRRKKKREGQDRRSRSDWQRALSIGISPAITPLIIGFTVLLVLISVLGLHSVRQMDEVGRAVFELQRAHAIKFNTLLQLRLALTKLNNEARARHAAESRGELKPPFNFKLGRAREDVTRLVRDIEKSVLSEHPSWRKFRNDLELYIEITQDSRRFSLESSAFDTVDRQLDDMLNTSNEEQDIIIARAESLEQEAARSIRFWSIVALIVGALVAAGTIWEMQRRFRQQRRSMFEARRERTFTTQLLEGMVNGVAALDENDRLRSANAAFFQIFPAASIGASVFEDIGPEDATRMLRAATATRAERPIYRGRWVCRVGEEQTEKSFDVYSSPLALDDEKGQLVTLVDATEVAEAERDLRRTESLAAVGQATAQVAHEIRNPLGSIRLGVSMLRDSVSDQDALNTIELVERGIQHLNKLVVDVTQFSRRKALERSAVNLHELLEMSLDLVAERIKNKETPVERQFTEEKIKGNWDADQLRQVFVNLIANAVDASPEKSQITIATELVSLDGRDNGDAGSEQRFARVTVSDLGKGMDYATRSRIFEPFFSTKKRGTGLGLAIVKQIIEQHEGRIGIDSEPDHGARFTVDLPL